MSRADESLEIPVADQPISGTLVRPDTQHPGILFVHGWGGNRQHYLARAREIAKLGCISLTIDLRGHGATDGARDQVTRADNLRDVLAAFDVLATTRGVDPAQMAIVGSSYGAYLAAIATQERDIRWLGLRVPALYQDAQWDVPKQQLDREALHAYRRVVHPPDANRALAACAAFRGDVLVVESEHDELVPHPTIQSYLGACTRVRSLTYRVLHGADHSLSTEAAQLAYTGILLDWVREMMAPRADPHRPARKIATHEGGETT